MILSRHARNNIRLYGIEIGEIDTAITSPDEFKREGIKHMALKQFPNRFSGFPLKVVYLKKGQEIFVITAYPLKGKSRRQAP